VEYEISLNGCLVISNSASSVGGGVMSCAVSNCIIYYNTALAAPAIANYEGESSLNYCGTTTPPTSGVGNLTSDPLFLDYAGGNLRLQSSSPCINAGFNAYAPGATDLDGNPRIVGGRVDMGAYESQNPNPPSPPQIIVNDGSFGCHSNQFGFNITGVNGQVVVVESSTNLVKWAPLATNTLGSAPLYLSDPDSTNFAYRFYRRCAP
jgi:hypothetical protein